MFLGLAFSPWSPFLGNGIPSTRDNSAQNVRWPSSGSTETEPPPAKARQFGAFSHVPLMANSDHANFAAHGIPALRLIAGFNAPDSKLRLLLTAADTRDKVRPDELDQALRLASTLTW